MKKIRMIAGAFALMLAITAGVLFVSAQNTKSESSSLLTQNIEALAKGELIIIVCQENYVGICFYDQYGPVPGTRID